MAAFINVEKKHIKFLLKQPGVQGAIQHYTWPETETRGAKQLVELST